MSPTLFIRADASPGMGIGHVTRCMALGLEWMAWGGRVCFISSAPDPALEGKLNGHGMDLLPLEAAWPDRSDLTRTLAYLETGGLDRGEAKPWVVIDGYHLGPDYQKGIREKGYPVLVLDDACIHPAYHADILLNQNPGTRRLPYQIPPECRMLTGSRYVLLRPEFARDLPRERDPGKGLRVLVTMGGSDPSLATPALVLALKDLNLEELSAKVVIGPSNSHEDRIRALIPAEDTTFELVKDPDMAGLMQWANLALTAGGSTCWELCRMGLPFMVFPVAENQTGIAKSLEADICALNAGPPDQLSLPEMREMIRTFIRDTARREAMSHLGRDLIDGEGARRVVREMMAGALSLKEEAAGRYNVTACVLRPFPIGQISISTQEDAQEIVWSPESPQTPPQLLEPMIRHCLARLTSDGNPIDRWTAVSPENLDAPPLQPQKITLVCDEDSWLVPDLIPLAARILCLGHRIQWHHQVRDIPRSDMAFYLSCGQIVPAEILGQNTHNLVVHGSALPRGRGWSPISWQILEGCNSIPVTLFEAAEKVDTGPIYLQKKMVFNGGELLPEIRKKTARYTMDLCLAFIENYDDVVAGARPPEGEETRYPRRGPEDSELNPDRTLAELFNLLRIVDNDRYPAFFTLKGRRYRLAITPMDERPHED